jgi:hypothetical protein
MLLRLALMVDPRAKTTNQLFQDLSSASTVTAATNATPIVVTAPNHGLQDEEFATLLGAVGNTAANNTISNPAWVVRVVDGDNVSLYHRDTSPSIGNGAWTSGGQLTGALIGTVEGSKTPQRLLDIYNDARYILFDAYRKLLDDTQLQRQINNQITTITDLTFAAGVAAKPTGYIRPVSLKDVSLIPIRILAPYEADLLNDLQSAKNRHVVEQNGNLESPNGNTFIADGADYVLSFFGITRYSLTDVMVGTTNESFIDDDHSNILQLAEAISRGSGVKEALVLAAKLIGLPQPSQIRTT